MGVLGGDVAAHSRRGWSVLQYMWIVEAYSLLEKFWRISLYVTDDAFARLYVTESLVQ